MLSISFWMAFITVFVLLLKMGSIAAALPAPVYRKRIGGPLNGTLGAEAHVGAGAAKRTLDALDRAA